MQKLAHTDLQIIEVLRKDARQTSKAMAAKVGGGEETMRRRIHQMVESGILKFTVDVSAEALGMPVQALIDVEGNFTTTDDLLAGFRSIHVTKIYDTVEDHQLYEIASPDLRNAADALTYMKSHATVTKATITFLYPNDTHRI